MGKHNPLDVLYLNRKFVFPAKSAHDVGKVDGGEKAEQKTEADVNAIEEKILASFCPAAEEAAPEKTQETAPAEEQSAPKAEEPKAEPLEPDDSPFVETASHAIRLDDLKFGRNYHGEE